MKNLRFKVLFFALICFSISMLSVQTATAQKLGLNLNLQAFGGDKIEDSDSINVNFNNKSSLSANLRIYDKRKWAIRLGLGVSDLEYSILDSQGIQTNFDVARRNMTAYLGLEKHFDLPFIVPYVGVFVPVTFNGDDKVSEVINNIATGTVDQVKNGSVAAGFSVLAGAQLKLFKILRVGAEFNVGFDNFKGEVVDNLFAGQSADIRFKNLDYNTEITLGLAF